MQAQCPRWTRPIHRPLLTIATAILTLAISACSGPPQTGATPRHPNAPAPGRAGALFDDSTARPEPAGAATSNHGAAGGPPAPSTREIQGYFTSTATRNSLRLWQGPNDQKGFERMTRFTVEVDGVPEYSRAVSTLRFVGVCRSSGKGLDQLLFSFYPERRGGGAVGVLRYATEKRRFMLGFAPKDARIDCAGGRAIFPEGAPAPPCTCPWRDGPDDRSGAAAATGDAREILILAEESGGPAFTRPDAGSEGLPEGVAGGDDRR